MIIQIKENEGKKQKILQKQFPKLAHFFLKQKRNANTFSQLYVLEKENKIVGYMIIDIIYERMELIEIEILKEHRRKGYGIALIEFMLQKAKEKKLENITLEVREKNKPAISLYEKKGFQKVAVRKKYYQDEDGILMERKMM